MTRKIRQELPKIDLSGHREITVEVNGAAVTRNINSRLLLSDFLRHELGLTGTHVGCEHGVCGCCTIIIDGASARSCLTLAVQVDGASLRTIEGVATSPENLHPIQQAFHECHALQCGFCTPGFIMSLISFFEENDRPDLSDDSIREALSGNLCRCTGYQNIVNAVRRAAELIDNERKV